MAISTNSVIHYTRNFENIKGILSRQGFKLKYCIENMDLVTIPNNSYAVNMVSFCDIPLSEIKNHIDSYGSYGIGLTKNWAKAMGLNPVLYIEKESYLAKVYKAQFKIYSQLVKAEKSTDHLGDNLEAFIQF